MRNLLVLTVACLGIMLASCKKEAGPIGPAGPAGPQGPEGNANVDVYNSNVDISTMTSWYVNNAYYSILSIPQTNQDAVIGFVYNSDGEWAAMPYLWYWNTGTNYNHYYYTILSDNSICVYVRNSNGIAPFSPMSGTISYRFFVVKGTTLSRLSKTTDVFNYNEIVRYLGVE